MTTRWTAARKEAVVADVRAGRLTFDEAIATHGLSAEELQDWERRFARHGRRGLASTRAQELRP